MWIIKWLFIILIMLMVLGFALQNQEQMVSVHILHYTSPNLPLYLLLYIAFAAGILVWVVVSVGHVLSLQYKLHLLRQENKRIQEELNRLRNLGITEEDDLLGLEEPLPPKKKSSDLPG